MQTKLDKKTFCDPMESRNKVVNLSHLRRPIRINSMDVVMDQLVLFNRLMIVTEREGDCQGCHAV